MSFYLFIQGRGHVAVEGLSRLSGSLRLCLSQYSPKHGETLKGWENYEDLPLSPSEDARLRNAYRKYFDPRFADCV